MPNIIDSSGIQIKTLTDIIDSIIEGTGNAPGLKGIYENDINVDSDTPDGQLVNIFALAVKDVLDLTVQTYNSFDPDLAIGRSLDMRCAINGVVRHGASYTQVTVRVTVDRALTLPGLDNAAVTPFTVSDAEGNRFVLKSTTAFPDLDPGSDSVSLPLEFRAEQAGRVLCLPNTITTQVTITLGVTGVNNPPGPLFLFSQISKMIFGSNHSLRFPRPRPFLAPQ